jgi:hypothetical protein
MDRAGHETASFFIGTEVEHTPAFGQRTLFVVGLQSIRDIDHQLDKFRHLVIREHNITHVYFGANQSFPNPDTNDATTWNAWEAMINNVLAQGFFATLDLDVSAVEGLLESGLVEQHRFIPMISVKLPYINQLGYNATLKIDDRDFAATNPGVWCHTLHDLQKREVFTDWSKYTQDVVLK